MRKDEATKTSNKSFTKSDFWKRILGQSDTSVVIAMFVLFLIFAGTDGFLSEYNIFNVARNASLYVFVALGQALVVVIGGMNLSLGAIGGLAVVATGFSIQIMGLPPWMAVIIALIAGVLSGAFNGIIITKLKLNSFVVTLATSFIYTGLVLGISKGYPYTKIPKSFTLIGRGEFFKLPYLFWLMLIILFIIYYGFKYTVTGRKILATGGNMEAARLSGINTDWIILLANMLSGFSAALAGVLWVSRMGSATPATGSDWMIISFAVAVIGGTALSGGAISAVGLFASAVMIALIKNGLIMVGVNVYFEQSFLGFIILLAVTVESFRARFNSARKV